MLFSSITFLVFFLPTILVFYYAIPNKTYRNLILLIASFLFYAWGEPKFVFLMLASIVVNYSIGLKLGENSFRKRKFLLTFGILLNIAVLFIFKYLGFSCKIIDFILSTFHFKSIQVINLIMPIGISFYTFQEISYLMDVYKNPSLAQKNFLNLGLYISFFPQLIAGPIVRYHDINEQIESRKESIQSFATGLERFIVGLSKKVLLANSYALVCDKIFDSGFTAYGTGLAWAATISYALQIYFDFSGYSDMAIGLAKMFGFDLLENFNYPYAASSITDFWRRWHISLTNFFRDYVYIPLGGNRKGKYRTILNRFIVFFTTGLWHGAAFNFIFWGLAHGALMIFERALPKTKKVFFSLIQRILTLFAVIFLWVLFRNGTADTIKIILKLFGINYSTFTGEIRNIQQDEILTLYIDCKFLILLAIGILLSFPWWRKIRLFYSNNKYISIFLTGLKYLILITLLILCYASLAANSYNPFIYFRF